MASAIGKFTFSTILLLCVPNCVTAADTFGCFLGNFNFTRLSTFNPWTAVDTNGQMVYDIYLCGTSSEVACSNSITVIGKNETSGRAVDFATCNNHSTTDQEERSELMLIAQGAPCPEEAGIVATTIIYFRCGKAMKSPVFLDNTGCSVYLEWELEELCEDLDQTLSEIPCYITNGTELIDLSPLTKSSGAYMVDTLNNQTFYINVCRDISPDSASGAGSCPKGSGSCRVVASIGADMGHPTNRLQMTAKGDILMVYTSPKTPRGCVQSPMTTVSFKCPERGGSRQPMLIGAFLCNIEIEWFTEYACPQKMLTSTSCQLTMDVHNIDIDISHLQRPSNSPYIVFGKSGAESYRYLINVCTPFGVQCGANSKGTAVCQKKPGEELFNKQLGQIDHQTLRFSDGELSLIYKGGDPCHTHFRRETIITFHCQKNADNDGVGKPEFREDTNCSYYFDWNTKYACLNQPRETVCSIDYSGQRFDLSGLMIETGNNWVAVSNEVGRKGHQYFLNVCHDVLHEGDAQRCPSGSAVCEIGPEVAFNLGSFTDGLTYDQHGHRLYINYTGGSLPASGCSSVYSTVIFICKPGEFESAPVLVYMSSDYCSMQFEWHTAFACPLSIQQGSECKVNDQQTGYSFDLSVMTKAEGYKVSAGGYDYYINVCGKLSGDHCQQAPHANAAVCQVKKRGSQSDDKKLGEPNGNLVYSGGVLNLTYTNGDAYNDTKETPRKTEIAFICDSAAGIGNPQFVHKQEQTYNFKWLTAYACPSQSNECVAEDETSEVYDLSSLSKSVEDENWVVLDDTDPAHPHKFYINVCRQLTPIHGLTMNGCDSFAAACETTVHSNEETVLHGNLGQAKSRPVIERGRAGYIRLVYADGELCPSGGEGARYNTTIHFICAKGQQSRGPSPPRKVGPCSYEILWDTEMACNMRDVVSSDTAVNGTESCTITDPRSNFLYNFHSLKKTGDGIDFYTAHSLDKTRTFRLNICGPVGFSSCGKLGNKTASVCEVKSDGSKVPLAYSEHLNLHFTKESNVLLTYLGQSKDTGPQTAVRIELSCDREAEENEMPVFIQQEGDDYLFHLSTPLSCPPQPVNCVVQDQAGNQYDLSSLAKLSGNWEVQDSRPSHRNLRYHINVCRPINEVSGVTCPGGLIGGCQTGGEHSYSLGFIQSKPQVASDGTITLRYAGGTLCHRGTPNEAQRSMRINFICESTERAPEFIGESASCEYSFSWRTPSACPQQRAVGHDCKVVDPLYNYEYDLTSLHKNASNYEVSGEDYTFLLNVCGALHSPPPECENMGCCQQGSTLLSPVPAGKYNSALIYDAGELSLVYSEGKNNCHGKYVRQTVLTFRCRQSGNEQEGPHYLQELDDCTYSFDWPTKLACPPHTIVDCTYIDNSGNLYDLSSLARIDGNYVETGSDDTKIIINICRSLVQRKGETCPFDSAACMINTSVNDLQQKYRSLGKVSANPVKTEEGKLVIRYSDGAPCSSGGNVSTLIIFLCKSSPGASGEGGPHPHFMRNNCEYVFVWETPAACPVHSQLPGQNCSVTNPNSGYQFNLIDLKRSDGWEVNDREGHLFKINVCSPVSNVACPSSAGSCQSDINNERHSFNAGKANAQLEFQRDGVLLLNYSGGDVCHHNISRSTIISFICQKDAQQSRPVFVASSDDCVYYFDWHTDLACEQEVSCEVDGADGTLDLTPLIKHSGHHLVLPDQAPPSKDSNVSRAGVYYINVCHPLNPILGTLCPPGAAVCLVQEGKPPQGLGQARSPPIYYGDRKVVVLKYDNGWPCEWNSAQNTSSRIIFHCKPGPQQGSPRLIEVSESCEYVFEWETNVICPNDIVEAENSSCSYYDARTATTYDLSMLNHSYQISAHQAGQFFLQVCGALSNTVPAACQGTAVCLQDSSSIQNGSYGKAGTGKFEMQGEQLKLTFTEGQVCQKGGGTLSTIILFDCDYSAGVGQPQLLPGVSCEVTFRWTTSLVCAPLVQDCVYRVGNIVYDLTILSQSKQSWEFIDSTDGSRYWLNLCQAVHVSAVKNECPPGAAVCRQSKDGRMDMIGSLKSQNISTQRSADGTDSVVVEYSQGSPACSINHQHSNNQVAKSIIRLMCGDTVGSPKLINRQENFRKCVFEFEWKTRAVCQKDSFPVELRDVNHVIQDPRSGGLIDLRPLLRGGNHKARAGQYYYDINLEGHLGLPGGACAGATVCQRKYGNTSFHHVLGTYISRKFYIQEDKLEVVYNSPEKCTGKFLNKSVSCIITFSCAHDSGQRTEPAFLYHTRDCVYLFSWETSAACFQAKIEVHGSEGNPVDDSSDGRSSFKTSTFTVIISTFSAIIVLCILAVYCHKPERRASAAARLKRIIHCQQRVDSQMKYSVLSQMDDDPEDLPGSNPFEEDGVEEENELQNGDTVMVRGYHDDSDDDMLL